MTADPSTSDSGLRTADSPSGPLLRAEGLVKEYLSGHVVLQVLKGVTLDVRAGEFLAVVGPSGSGKSTLLHCLGFLDRPTRGDVLFGGARAAELSDAERARVRNRSFGFVFQFYHLLPDLTALENVLVPLMIGHTIRAWMAGGGGARKRGEELLERVGLRERMHHLPSELSGGERQRVAIARALATDPRVLLCDEPTGSLDMATSRGILDLLLDLHRRDGKTLVFVTHDETVARKADRLVRLVDGKLTG